MLKLDAQADFDLSRVEGACCFTERCVCGKQGVCRSAFGVPLAGHKRDSSTSVAYGQIRSVEQIVEFAKDFEFCPFLAHKPRNVEILGRTEIDVGEAGAAEGVAACVTLPGSCSSTIEPIDSGSRRLVDVTREHKRGNGIATAVFPFGSSTGFPFNRRTDIWKEAGTSVAGRVVIESAVLNGKRIAGLQGESTSPLPSAENSSDDSILTGQLRKFPNSVGCKGSWNIETGRSALGL